MIDSPRPIDNLYGFCFDAAGHWQQFANYYLPQIFYITSTRHVRFPHENKKQSFFPTISTSLSVLLFGVDNICNILVYR